MHIDNRNTILLDFVLIGVTLIASIRCIGLIAVFKTDF
jgi:hypothetical protein